MNQITLIGEKLCVSFRFNPKIVAEIRKIDGREWNPEQKRWEIPKENIEEALAVLTPLGFLCSADVTALKDKIEEQKKAIDTIKEATDWKYDGVLPLFDFQRKGAAFMKSMPSALLADVPGLGKSIQTIAATEHESKILIFCPSTLKYSWDTEIKKWFPEAKVMVIDGDKDARQEQWVWAKDPRYKYVIANYELLIFDFDLMRDFFWPVIVCDEATRISNPEAKTVKALKELKSGKRLALTGTPVSNSPVDIWSIIDWIVPRYLGSYYQFKQKYCITSQEWGYGRDYERITGYQNLEELSQKVNRFMLRRTKEEVFNDFPPKTVEDVIITLTERERNLYNSIKMQVIDEIRKLGDLNTSTLHIVPVKMLRLKQTTGHPSLVGAHGQGDAAKLETLKTKVKEIYQSGEKAIIFTQFAEMLYILEKELVDFRPLSIYGGVDTVERMVKVKEFNDDPKPRVIIMTEAGAYGLNMQSASYVFHYDAPWSIAKLQQREDRAHRIGNKKPVTVYNMIAKDTIDEYVMKVLKRKGKVSNDILKDAERIAETDLTREDIDEILRM